MHNVRSGSGLPSAFSDFLAFEQQFFEDRSPIAEYDPYLIRYGEYRFVLDVLGPSGLGVVLDVGCENNIFMLYLALRGARVIGIDINPTVQQLLDERVELVQNATGSTLDVSFRVEDATKLTLEPSSIDHVVGQLDRAHVL
jgi:hypothetical protein